MAFASGSYTNMTAEIIALKEAWHETKEISELVGIVMSRAVVCTLLLRK